MKLFALILFLILPLFSVVEVRIYKDYQEGLEAATKERKPVFLLFAGLSCTNNLKVIQMLKENDEVASLLRDDFVQIHLYVDDRTALVKPYKSGWEGQEILISTLGDKWGDLERKKYECKSQPRIYMIDHNEKLIRRAVSFDEFMLDPVSCLQQTKSTFVKGEF